MRYIITLNILLLCFAASAQTVNLSRMERALGKDRIIFTDSTGKQQYRLLRNILDTMITAGNVGSGTTNTIAMWSADTLRNSRITQQDSTITVTPVTSDFPFTFRYRAFGMPYTFYPELRYQWLGFYGDDDVGIKYTGTNNFQLFAGSGATNRYLMEALASSVSFDGNRDGVVDFSIGSTTNIRRAELTSLSSNTSTHFVGLTSADLATKVALGSGLSISAGAAVDTLKATSTATTIDTFSLTNDTLRLSLTGDSQPAKIVSLLPSYAQISSYSSEAITATAITKYAPASGWVDFESGDLDAQGASNQINPSAAMKARITLSASVYMDGGSFAGYVNFYIYKNGSLLTPATYSLGKFDTDEYKVVGINILADLAANDEIDFRYSLSTALGGGTMYMYNPILTVEKL